MKKPAALPAILLLAATTACTHEDNARSGQDPTMQHCVSMMREYALMPNMPKSMIDQCNEMLNNSSQTVGMPKDPIKPKPYAAPQFHSPLHAYPPYSDY